MTMKHTKQSIISKDGVSYLIPFILITSCFALWGFANDITNPMVKAFSKIFRMSATDGALVQVAFYGGYFAMAFPAAIFIRKYSYKAGVLLGLGMYAFGAFLFFPAKMTGEYYPFLIAYFILTCGLSFLETSCNPYILSMGTEETATRRLNLAQSFNPMGSLLGMYVAMQFIQAKLHPMCTEERALLNDSEFQAIKESDLTVLIAPYLIIGLIILAMLIVIRLVKMPKNGDQNHKIDFFPTLKRIFMETRYREGVIAQFFYVGAQIMCWTFIIQYGTHLFMSPDFGMDEKSAEVLSQQYNIAIKYNRTGGRVTVTARQKEKHVYLSVEDTGNGIPEELKDRVFEPFFRVDKSRSRELGGVGLGLALVREIVIVHDGNIAVKSNPSGGTIFEVVL